MEFRPSRRTRGGLDLSPLRAVSLSITPLVDTMLNILIFVLLLGAFAVQPALRVRLPEAVSKDDTLRQFAPLALANLSTEASLSALANLLAHSVPGTYESMSAAE